MSFKLCRKPRSLGQGDLCLQRGWQLDAWRAGHDHRFRHWSDKIDFKINDSNGVPLFQGNITGTGSLTLNAHSVAYVETGNITQVLLNTSNAAENGNHYRHACRDMKISLLGIHLGLAATDFHHA